MFEFTIKSNNKRTVARGLAALGVLVSDRYMSVSYLSLEEVKGGRQVLWSGTIVTRAILDRHPEVSAMMWPIVIEAAQMKGLSPEFTADCDAEKVQRSQRALRGHLPDEVEALQKAGMCDCTQAIAEEKAHYEAFLQGAAKTLLIARKQIVERLEEELTVYEYVGGRMVHTYMGRDTALARRKGREIAQS